MVYEDDVLTFINSENRKQKKKKNLTPENANKKQLNMYKIKVTLPYKYSLQGGTASDIVLALWTWGVGWWVAWRFVWVLFGAAAAQEAPSY